MSFTIGSVVGAVLAMALFGALAAWIVRRATAVGLTASYAIGIVVAVLAGSAVYAAATPGATYADALLRYGIGGIVAFPLLLVTARRKGR